MSSELTHAAVMGLPRIYTPWFDFAKAEVMLLDLIPDTQLQSTLAFEEPSVLERPDGRARYMGAMDLLNECFCRSTVHLVSNGTGQYSKQWVMRPERVTSSDTTRWEDVAVVRA